MFFVNEFVLTLSGCTGRSDILLVAESIRASPLTYHMAFKVPRPITNFFDQFTTRLKVSANIFGDADGRREKREGKGTSSSTRPRGAPITVKTGLLEELSQ